MATINPHTTRATGTILTAAIYNADHQNHISNANALNSELVLVTADMIVAEAGIAQLMGFPSLQAFTASATITFTPGTRFAMFEGVASGGAGGGTTTNGAASVAGAGGGGGPGRYGCSSIIDVSAIPTATLTIGNGGLGAAGAVGGTGGDVVVVCGAVTYTWKGGSGGQLGTLSGSVNQIVLGGAELGSTNLITGGSTGPGGLGLSMGTETTAVGGAGGSTPFGTGGYNSIRTSAGVAHGIDGNNYGSGGSGAAGCGATGVAGIGGDGAKGYMKVWQW